MIRQPARIAAAALLLLSAACSAASPRPSSPSRDRSILTYEEMAQAGHTDAFATVQSLRPQWLRQRAQTSSRTQTIKVYLDGVLLGPPELLRQITTRSVATIQYLNSLQASERFGLDHDMGALVVTTRRD